MKCIPVTVIVAHPVALSCTVVLKSQITAIDENSDFLEYAKSR
jgi:hypothetical protein